MTEDHGKDVMAAKKRPPLRNVTNERKGPQIGASNAMVRSSLSIFMALLFLFLLFSFWVLRSLNTCFGLFQLDDDQGQ